jgi:serine/threonine protein kinase
MPETPRRIGRYEIVREIGRGGMAAVYLAHQSDLGRHVALKQLAGVHAADPSALARFLHESRLTGRLAHQNIVTVHEYFEHGGVPYIAMEYLPRGSLRSTGPLSLAQIGGVLECVLAALAYAGARGIVHRDLKPENLLVTEAGGIKVADFGIAKALGDVAPGFATGTGTAIGTPAYMAPEQATAGAVSPATDLYATGVVAYELLVGRVPFTSEDTPLAVLLQHVNEPPPPPRSVNPALDPELGAWLEWMLAKRQEDRPRDAAAAWERLEEILIRAVGPRWRREAVLPGAVEPPAVPPSPLLPPSPLGLPTPPASAEGYRTFGRGKAPDEAGPEPAPEPTPQAPAEPPHETGFATYEPPGRAPPPPQPPPQQAPPQAPPPQPPPPQPPRPPEAAEPPAGEGSAGEDTIGAEVTQPPEPAVVPGEPRAELAPGRRRRRQIAIGAAAAVAVLAAVLAIVLVAGGGADDDASAGGPATRPATTASIPPTQIRLTQAEYRDAANTICRDLPDLADLFGSVETPDQLRSVLQLALSSSLRPAAARLGALEPPVEWDAAHREVLAAVDEEITLLEHLVDTIRTDADPRASARSAAMRLDEVTRVTDGHWRTFGATECVEGAAVPSRPSGEATPS